MLVAEIYVVMGLSWTVGGQPHASRFLHSVCLTSKSSDQISSIIMRMYVRLTNLNGDMIGFYIKTVHTVTMATH